jgi:hypothetical protein
VEFKEGHKHLLDKLLPDLPRARAGKMFGFPGYYAGPKLFACLFGTGVALKLPPARVTELLKKPGFSPFLPRGRQMTGWLMFEPRKPADLRNLPALFRESLEYVAGLRIEPGRTRATAAARRSATRTPATRARPGRTTRA